MKKINMLIFLILSLGLMLTACGSGEEESDYSIYVPPPPPSLDTSLFVAVGGDGIIVYSDDGAVWYVNDSLAGDVKNLKDIASGSWFAVGNSYTDGLIINLEDTENPQFLLKQSLYSITTDGSGNWVAVGLDKNVSKYFVAISNDGKLWNIIHAAQDVVLNDVAYGNGIWIAAGLDINSNNGIVVKSDNNWADSPITVMGGQLFSVFYGSGNWIAAGEDGTIVTSTDGNTWVPASSSGTPYNLYGVASDGSGNWIAVGENGTIVTSTDGNIWVPASSSGTTNHLYGIVSDGNGSWFAVGMNGTIIISTDNGDTWSTVISGTTKTLNAIAFMP